MNMYLHIGGINRFWKPIRIEVSLMNKDLKKPNMSFLDWLLADLQELIDDEYSKNKPDDQQVNKRDIHHGVVQHD